MGMAGHSKWANIKRRKGAADAVRARIFTKLIREVTIAARLGGGNPDSNARLRLAVDKARAQSVPKDRIDKAILKGSGGGDEAQLEEITYEGYGPCGVAILVETATDNKNRTVSEVRNTFSKKNGNLGESGSVAWMFEKKGILRLPDAAIDENTLIDKALNAGAEDVTNADGIYTITTSFADFHHIKENLEKQGLVFRDDSGVEMVPKNLVPIAEEEQAKKLMVLIEALEELDDVQHVWANFDINDALLDKLHAA